LSLQYIFLGAKKAVHSVAEVEVFEDFLYLEKATLEKKILVALNEISRTAAYYPSLQYFTMQHQSS
jgi:hypothetical protein